MCQFVWVYVIMSVDLVVLFCQRGFKWVSLSVLYGMGCMCFVSCVMLGLCVLCAFVCFEFVCLCVGGWVCVVVCVHE